MENKLIKQEQRSIDVILAKPYENGGVLSYNSYESILNKPTSKMLAHYSNEEKNAIFEVVMDLVANTIGMGGKFTATQITFITRAFLQYDQYLTLEDIGAVINMGLVGRFGKMYGGFSLDLVGVWIDEYKNNLAIVRENEIKQKPEILSLGEIARAKPPTTMLPRIQKLIDKATYDRKKKAETIIEYCGANNINYSTIMTIKAAYWDLLFKAQKDQSPENKLKYAKRKEHELLIEMNSGRFKFNEKEEIDKFEKLKNVQK